MYFNLIHFYGTLPDLHPCLKIFSLLRATSAVPANQVSARTADVAVASCNVPVSACDRSDIVYAADDIVSGPAEAEVYYEGVCFAAAFASVSEIKNESLSSMSSMMYNDTQE